MNELIRAYSNSGYNILKCASDGQLQLWENQLPTGDEVIEELTKRKYPLYIEIIDEVFCMKFLVCWK